MNRFSPPLAVVLDGTTLTPEAVARLAGRHATASLAPAARERNAASRSEIAALLDRGDPLYGASTGVGALHDRAVPAAEREALQWNLLRSHAVDTGPPLPEAAVRAGMAVRANQLAAGGTGVVPELLDALVAALDREPVVVGSLGALGTGDLPGLARIALTLLDRDAGGPHRVRLGLRDAIGFISSNALTAGRACLLWEEAAALHELWLTIAALSFEAIAADPIVLAAPVQEATGDPGQIAVAARMRLALGLGPGASGLRALAHGATGARIQGPFPFRVVPQVDGVTTTALATLRTVLTREINARGVNALIDQGRAWPNGNFHAAALTGAVDALRSALAASAALIAGRVAALMDPALTGCTPFLAARPGRDSGLMMLEYAAHAAAAQTRVLASPAGPYTASLAHQVESHHPLAPVSVAQLAEQLPALRTLLAAELIAAMRACTLGRRRPRGPVTGALFAHAARLAQDGVDRDLGQVLVTAGELITTWIAARSPAADANDVGLPAVSAG